jgi:hypothetical protein
MVKINKNLTDLKNLIPSELMSIYQIDITSIKVDLQEKGMLSPIVLSKDGIPIDGYRRLLAAIDLKLEEVPVIQTELEASKENRVTLNQHREKTWMDKRSDYVISFETFCNQQGQKDSLVKYDRYEQIKLRTGSRYKDAKTLRDVEWILTHDVEGFPMAYWLLEKGVEVKYVKAAMEVDINLYPKILKQVKDKKLNPKTAIQQIEREESLKQPIEASFILPDSEQKVEIFNGQKEDLLLELKDNEIKTLFYHIDPMPSDFKNPNSSNQTFASRLDAYSTKNAFMLRDFTNTRLSERGSAFISLSEYYDGSGFAKRMAERVIKAVEKETGLIYKQTIYISPKSLENKESTLKLVDGMEMMLWFVKEAGYIGYSIPKLLIKEDDITGINKDSFAYKTCTNYLDTEIYQNLIKANNIPKGIVFSKEDGSKGAFDNPAAFLPIKLTTKPGELVVDLSMKHDVAQISTLLNRRYIGVTNDKSVYGKVKAKVSATVTAKSTKSVSVKITDPGNIGVGKTKKTTKSKAVKKTNNPV